MNRLHPPQTIQESMRLFFTKMYKVIRNHPSAQEIYQRKLLESGQVMKEDIDQLNSKVLRILNEEFMASKDYVPQTRDWLSAYWADFKSPEQQSRIRNTGVKPKILKNVGKAITTLPETFKPGQNVERGTFTHRRSLIQPLDMMPGRGLMSRRVLTREFSLFDPKKIEDTSAFSRLCSELPADFLENYSFLFLSLGSLVLFKVIVSQTIRSELIFGKGDILQVSNKVGEVLYKGIVIDKTFRYVVIKEQSGSDELKYIPYIYLWNKDMKFNTKHPFVEPTGKKWYYLWLK